MLADGLAQGLGTRGRGVLSLSIPNRRNPRLFGGARWREVRFAGGQSQHFDSSGAHLAYFLDQSQGCGRRQALNAVGKMERRGASHGRRGSVSAEF